MQLFWFTCFEAIFFHRKRWVSLFFFFFLKKSCLGEESSAQAIVYFYWFESHVLSQKEMGFIDFFLLGEFKQIHLQQFLVWCLNLTWRARGNQRDKDRERAQARKKDTKGKDDGLTPEQRRERFIFPKFLFICCWIVAFLNSVFWISGLQGR